MPRNRKSPAQKPTKPSNAMPAATSGDDTDSDPRVAPVGPLPSQEALTTREAATTAGGDSDPPVPHFGPLPSPEALTTREAATTGRGDSDPPVPHFGPLPKVA
jgi:hypothetical protein